MKTRSLAMALKKGGGSIAVTHALVTAKLVHASSEGQPVGSVSETPVVSEPQQAAPAADPATPNTPTP